MATLVASHSMAESAPIYVNKSYPNGYKYLQEMDNNAFSFGIEVLYFMLRQVNEMGNEEFRKMKFRSELATEARKYSGMIDSFMSEPAMAKSDGTRPMDQAVFDFMSNNNIQIGNQSIKEYMQDKDWSNVNKGQWMAMKTAIDNLAGKCQDVYNEGQLKIQKFTQTMTMMSNLISSLQTVNYEMNKTIIASMR